MDESEAADKGQELISYDIFGGSITSERSSQLPDDLPHEGSSQHGLPALGFPMHLIEEAKEDGPIVIRETL